MVKQIASDQSDQVILGKNEINQGRHNLLQEFDYNLKWIQCFTKRLVIYQISKRHMSQCLDLKGKSEALKAKNNLPY